MVDFYFFRGNSPEEIFVNILMKIPMKKFHFVFPILIFFLTISCKNNEPVGSLIDNTLITLNESDYRPNFHFTPPLHWMNDPNGLVYYKGEYHLFYQYNPGGSTWGPMNWGHAISTDLFNWQDLSIALTPDNLGTIFSGSAVVDSLNTSGFQSGDELPLVAIYTSAGTMQSQSVAYSNDKGRNWTKYSNNPVLPNHGVNDFRDPKVSWYAPLNRWIMALATGNKISFYSSADLKSWTFESDFGIGFGAHGGVWECPDLFQMKVEGTNLKKWVLIVSINPGGPNGGSATQYFTGNFDGKTFTADSNVTSWVDYGTDNYAGVTYSNLPTADGRRIMIGWMSNWNYAGLVPTTSWRSTMTVPRVVTLIQYGTSFKLRFNPVDELKNYKNQLTIENQIANKAVDIENNEILKSGSYELNFDADLSISDSLKIITGNLIEKLIILFDKNSGLVTIDRSHSGPNTFSNFFKQNVLCNSLNLRTDKKIDVRMLIDKTSVELFWNHGENSMTALFFPAYQYNYMKVEGNTTYPFISNFTLNGLNKSLKR